MKIEHHDLFTAVYWYGNLAAIVFGDRSKREAKDVTYWETISTDASTLDDLDLEEKVMKAMKALGL